MNFIFKRPKLARIFCDSLEGKGIVNALSGLFLTAPRRVGKTTFILNELSVEATKRGWVIVYVDLWSNLTINPADLITSCIKNKILDYKSKLSKLTKKVKLDKVKIGGAVEFDFNNSMHSHKTLTEALRLLNELSKKPILLIIDEAQQALQSKDAMDAMFAIKSARDQLNYQTKNQRLMLVFTGSNRDKLGQLVLKKNNPFYGASLTLFPLLDQQYTDTFTDLINSGLSKQNQFSKESMFHAFQLIGYRPEILRQIVGNIALQGEAKNFEKLLKRDASLWKISLYEEYLNSFVSLTKLQKVILINFLESETSWSPFAEQSIKAYSNQLGIEELSTATVQTAIQGLRDRGLLWQSSRGGYALEDESFGIWLKNYCAATNKAHEGETLY